MALDGLTQEGAIVAERGQMGIFRGALMNKLTLIALWASWGSSFALIDLDQGAQTTGRATYYSSTTTVACDIPSSDWPAYVAALSEPQFQNGLACGASAHLKWTPKGSTTVKEMDVMIVDLCPTADNKQWCSGDFTHFDLMSSATFSVLDNSVLGVLHGLSFDWQPAPVTGNLKYRIKTSTGYPYYAPIQVYNSRYPISKVEVQNSGSTTWVTGDRTQTGMWNWFVFNWTGKGLVMPFQIRVTDQYGATVTETVTSGASSGASWTGTQQFALRPADQGTPTAIHATPIHTDLVVRGTSLSVPAAALLLDVTVLNLQGREVSHHVIQQAGIWEVPNLPEGMHVLHTRAMNLHSEYTQSFIISK